MGGHGPPPCSLTLPFPNKTWFHIAHPVSPLPFSITVVFITHDFSFPTPHAKTHSFYSTAPCKHTMTGALCCRLEAPCPPTQKGGAKRTQIACPPVSPLPMKSGLLSTLQSAVGEIDVNRGKKGNKASFPPLPGRNHILLPT